MQCLSVKQPWATLLVAGATRYLVRRWHTTHRGPLAIEASRRLSRVHIELCCDPEIRSRLQASGYDYAIELPLQALVGTVTLVDCRQITAANRGRFNPNDLAVQFGLLQPGLWVWICTNPQRLGKPVPCAGRRGLFPVSDSIWINRGERSETQKRKEA
jgi:hypothetical protein